MDKLDFIFKRKSVRKYQDRPVPKEDIEKMLQAAVYAPSGKNHQNWHFVVVRSKTKINEIAQAILDKNAQIAAKIKDETRKNAFTKFSKYAVHFKNAPVLILVYAGPYDVTAHKELLEIGASQEEIEELLRPAPGIQNIAAALENLMLAAANLGYGTCWMTSQNYAAKEITKVIGFNKPGYFLAAMTPLGVPDGEPKTPPRKPLEEVVSFVD